MKVTEKYFIGSWKSDVVPEYPNKGYHRQVMKKFYVMHEQDSNSVLSLTILAVT